MRLEQLYNFVKTADLRSFSAASSALFISQQALSASIKNLEKEFHTSLLIRTPKGVVLSEDGKYFYDMARRILSNYEQLYNHFLRPEDPTAFSLRIALNSKVKNYFFPKIISYFYKEYPHSQITYDTMTNDAIVQALLNHKADLGVLPILEIDKTLQITLPSELVFAPFLHSEYALLTSIHSPLANFGSISMTTILKYPLILNATGNHDSDLFYQLARHYTDNPEIIWTDSTALQQQMVSDNIGNTFYMRQTCLPSNNVCKIPITNNITIQVGFLLPANAPDNTFRNLFLQKAQNLLNEDFLD